MHVLHCTDVPSLAGIVISRTHFNSDVVAMPGVALPRERLLIRPNPLL